MSSTGARRCTACRGWSWGRGARPAPARTSTGYSGDWSTVSPISSPSSQDMPTFIGTGTSGGSSFRHSHGSLTHLFCVSITRLSFWTTLNWKNFTIEKFCNIFLMKTCRSSIYRVVECGSESGRFGIIFMNPDPTFFPTTMFIILQTFQMVINYRYIHILLE